MADKNSPAGPIDLVAGNLKLPPGYQPASFIALGQMDGQAGLSAGPTAAKTVANQARRTITVNVAQMPDMAEIPAGVLGAALDEAKKMSRGTVTEVKDRTVQGRLAKQVCLHHKQGAMSVVSYLIVIGAPGWLWTVVHSSLDEPKALEGMRKDYEAFLEGMSFKS